MLFNSFTFLIFFAVVLFGYYVVLRNWTHRKGLLLVASYLFYAAWNPPFALLLVISTVVDWFVAKKIAATDDPGRKRTFLFASLGTNLGLLAYFKYGGFFLENMVQAMNAAGIAYQPPELDIVLPVGISFYTFQTLSYTIDIYRGDGKPWPSFLDFALFVSFFPQLVAGPIVRAFEFLPQCVEERRATAGQFGWGLALLVLGLFQKTVIADHYLAPIADKAYAPHAAAVASFADAWTGTLAFAGQIFCDFAGYSTCAIGVAMCLGFALPDNFRFPYAAIGFSDFWRRWHISLSQWLRDYLYISLGGNRRGTVRTYVNLSLTMLLGGLWHGASWMFVIWGALHGLYLVGERLAKWVYDRALPESKPGRATRFAGGVVTFVLVCIAWVFFRASELDVAFDLLAAMCVPDQIAPAVLGARDLVFGVGWTAVVIGVHVIMRDRSVESVAAALPRVALVAGLAAMLVMIATTAGDSRAFIYFQF